MDDLASNIVIYSKQPGEQAVPVTARIEWLPDSSIKPLMYWTPDGSCFEVKHVYACTPIAFLKERGTGIRFKVKAEVTKAPAWEGGFLRLRHETYLYFADERFCGKNFIDGRYGHEAKEFIPVILDIFPGGEYELISFRVERAQYIVIKTIAVEPHASFRAGGIGIRHKVDTLRISAENTEGSDFSDFKETIRHTGAVFFEVNKWFVVKAPHKIRNASEYQMERNGR